MPLTKRFSALALVTTMSITIGLAASVFSAEKAEPDDEPGPISASEPFAVPFSLEKAAHALDAASLHWQKTRKCGTCHTNYAHLMARTALEPIKPVPTEVRVFFDEMVTKTWPEKGPRWPAEVVMAGATMAIHDRATTGKL